VGGGPRLPDAAAMTILEQFLTPLADRPVAVRLTVAVCAFVAVVQALVWAAIAIIGGHVEATLLLTAAPLAAIAGAAVWLSGPAKEPRDLL
jgi:hypothetical protein